MYWTDKSPDQINADLGVMFDAIVNDALNKAVDMIFVRLELVILCRAYVRFGQPITRANRHKFRRCILLEKQGAP